MKDACAIISAELCGRRAQRKSGLTGEDHDDTMSWLEIVSKGRKFDPVATQLGLSVGAIHTTGDLLTQVLFDLIWQPQLFQPLREELVTVLGQQPSWDQKTLAGLKLMDSVIKESQRLKPLSAVSMRRTTTSKVQLSDGTILKPGTTTYVSAHRMWDSDVYVNPLEFNGYRFLKMREENGDRALGAQLVSTGPDHLAWGHGQYACPGRFFAANEIKIVLSHLLLKYDWKPAGVDKSKVLDMGLSMNSDPFIGVMVRRREEEIQL